MDKAGNESAGSADKRVTTVDRTAPLPPVLSATDDPVLGVELDWQDDASARRTAVYRRRDAADGSYTSSRVSYGYAPAPTDRALREGLDYKVVAVRRRREHRAPRSRRPQRAGRSPRPPCGREHARVGTRFHPALEAAQAATPRTTRCTARSRPTLTPPGRGHLRLPHRGPHRGRLHESGCTDYAAAARRPTYTTCMASDSAGRESAPSGRRSRGPGDEIPPPNVTGLTADPRSTDGRWTGTTSTAADLRPYVVYGPTNGGRPPEYIATSRTPAPPRTSSAPTGRTARYQSTFVDRLRHLRQLPHLPDSNDPVVAPCDQELAKVNVTELDAHPDGRPRATRRPATSTPATTTRPTRCWTSTATGAAADATRHQRVPLGPPDQHVRPAERRTPGDDAPATTPTSPRPPAPPTTSSPPSSRPTARRPSRTSTTP